MPEGDEDTVPPPVWRLRVDDRLREIRAELAEAKSDRAKVRLEMEQVRFQLLEAKRAYDQLLDGLNGNERLGTRGRFGELVDKMEEMASSLRTKIGEILAAQQMRAQRARDTRIAVLGGLATLIAGVIVLVLQNHYQNH